MVVEDAPTVDGLPADSTLADTTASDAAANACKLGTAALAKGYHTRTLQHGGLTRKYTVYLPTQYEASQAMPLVLALHGGYGTADGMKDYSGFNATADTHGFIVAYPEGDGKSWNAGDCCGDLTIDDVGFIGKVLDDLETVACVDPKRVYATGMSNGSMMSHRLACELSLRVTAIAGVAGQLGTSYLQTCAPARKVPILHIHGTEDGCAPFSGGTTGGGCTYWTYSVLLGVWLPKRLCTIADPPVTDPDNPPSGLAWKIQCLGHQPYIPSLLHTHPPVSKTIDFWLAHNQCDTASPKVTTIGSVVVSTYTCAPGGEVKFYKILGGGHSWPGGPDSTCCEVYRAANQNIDANEEIWAFFKGKSM
jgi:polyhydroxybutyrate depolymerase